MSAEQQSFSADTANQEQEIQIDDSLLQHQQDDTVQHQQQQASQVFVDKDGVPFEFYIPETEAERDVLADIIAKHGGKLSSDPNQGYYVSSLAEVHRDVIDPRFIYESDARGKLPIDEYKLLPPTGIYQAVNTTATDAESETAHRLVSYLGQQPVAQSTQQEEPDEDQQQLKPHETAVAQRQAQQLITASHQNHSSSSEVSVNKVGFTYEEDELILEYVRRNPNRRSSHKLFDEIAQKIGKHTGNSVRYRYRNFIAHKLEYVYKTDAAGELIYDADGKPIISEVLPQTLKTKYTAKDDYEICKAVKLYLLNRPDGTYQPNPKDVILPGKFFTNLAATFPHHTQASWRDRYRKFAIPYGIDKYIEYYENELKDGRIPDPIKNFTGRFLTGSKKAKKSDETSLDEVVGETLSEHNDQFNKRQQKAQKQSQAKRRKASNPNDQNNVFLAGGTDVLGDLTSSNLFHSHAAAAVAAANKANDSRIVDPEDFLTDDLVSAKFFEFQPLISVVSLVEEIVSRNYQSSDAEALIDALYVETGIQRKFGTFIVTAVCGDMALIPKFIELFLKTGENPPENVHGIWTPRDDQYLRSGDPDRLEYLKRLHGVKRIELRKDFINQDLV